MYFSESSETEVAGVVLSRKFRNGGSQGCTFQKAPRRSLPGLYFPESSETEVAKVVLSRETRSRLYLFNAKRRFSPCPLL